MRMEETEGGMSALELRLSNWASLTNGGAEYAFGAGAKLKLGAEIAVYAGDEAQPREIFHGTITAIEGEYATGSPPEMTVLAEDALQRARMAPPQPAPSRQVAGRRRARHRRRPRPHAGHRRARHAGRNLGAAQRERPRVPAPPARALRRRSAGRRQGAARLAARRRAARRARAGAVQPARQGVHPRRSRRPGDGDHDARLECGRRQGGVRQGQRPHPRRTGPGTRRRRAAVADAGRAQRASRPCRGRQPTPRRRPSPKRHSICARGGWSRSRAWPKATRSCGSARIAAYRRRSPVREHLLRGPRLPPLRRATTAIAPSFAPSAPTWETTDEPRPSSSIVPRAGSRPRISRASCRSTIRRASTGCRCA